MTNIFLLTGQSNMAGRGPLDAVDPIRHPDILVYREDGWAEAHEPLHTDKPTAGAGLAMSFAELLLEHFPGARIGLVPCAEGGSPLSRWMPKCDLSERALALTRAALEHGELRGILWHQGESDSGNKSDAMSYAARLAKVIAHLREQLSAPAVPFLSGELGSFMRAKDDKPYFAVVNDALRELTATTALYACVSARELADKGDEIHFGSLALREFGRRYAQEYLKLVQQHHLPPLQVGAGG